MYVHSNGALQLLIIHEMLFLIVVVELITWFAFFARFCLYLVLVTSSFQHFNISCMLGYIVLQIALSSYFQFSFTILHFNAYQALKQYWYCNECQYIEILSLPKMDEHSRFFLWWINPALSYLITRAIIMFSLELLEILTFPRLSFCSILRLSKYHKRH